MSKESSAPSPDRSERKGSGILYFAFGAMSNPVSRSKRDVRTVWERPAFLPGFRLVFSRGIGNVVSTCSSDEPEVHGVLMEFERESDWDTVCGLEAGYDVHEAPVVPYQKMDNGECKRDPPVKARFFQLPAALGRPLEDDLPPPERYLRIIVLGLEHHNVDSNHIQMLKDHPRIPAVKPEDYLTLPVKGSVDSLPVITRKEYHDLCNNGDPLFLIGKSKVIRILNYHDSSSYVKWLQTNAIGKDCVSWTLFRTLYDPDLPHCEEREEMEPLHYKWIEHEVATYAATSGVNFEHVMVLSTEEP